jgi:hypothetical protein
MIRYGKWTFFGLNNKPVVTESVPQQEEVRPQPEPTPDTTPHSQHEKTKEDTEIYEPEEPSEVPDAG